MGIAIFRFSIAQLRCKTPESDDVQGLSDPSICHSWNYKFHVANWSPHRGVRLTKPSWESDTLVAKWGESVAPL